MKKEVLGFLKDFFDMVVRGKTDYDQMALASLGVNKKNRKSKLFNFIELSSIAIGVGCLQKAFILGLNVLKVNAYA